jgi:hypothetical protein
MKKQEITISYFRQAKKVPAGKTGRDLIYEGLLVD